MLRGILILDVPFARIGLPAAGLFNANLIVGDYRFDSWELTSEAENLLPERVKFSPFLFLLVTGYSDKLLPLHPVYEVQPTINLF